MVGRTADYPENYYTSDLLYSGFINFGIAAIQAQNWHIHALFNRNFRSRMWPGQEHPERSWKDPMVVPLVFLRSK